MCSNEGLCWDELSFMAVPATTEQDGLRNSGRSRVPLSMEEEGLVGATPYSTTYNPENQSGILFVMSLHVDPGLKFLHFKNDKNLSITIGL
eukprot:g18967.t1